MSSVITGDRRQLALEFEPGLATRFRNAREVVAQGVYRRGLKTTAADLNKAPGNLSVELSDDGVRHFSLDSFEEYLQVTGDMQPLYYLVDRYLGGEGAARADALDRVMRMAEQLERLPDLLAAAGVTKRGKR